MPCPNPSLDSVVPRQLDHEFDLVLPRYYTNMATTNGLTSVSDDSEISISPWFQHQSTLAVHGDDHLNRSADVSPALHVSTTFRYTSNPLDLVPAKDMEVRHHPFVLPTKSVLQMLCFHFAVAENTKLMSKIGASPARCPHLFPRDSS